jgi:hypothetical protein
MNKMYHILKLINLLILPNIQYIALIFLLIFKKMFFY